MTNLVSSSRRGAAARRRGAAAAARSCACPALRASTSALYRPRRTRGAARCGMPVVADHKMREREIAVARCRGRGGAGRARGRRGGRQDRPLTARRATACPLFKSLMEFRAACASRNATNTAAHARLPCAQDATQCSLRGVGRAFENPAQKARISTGRGSWAAQLWRHSHEPVSARGCELQAHFRLAARRFAPLEVISSPRAGLFESEAGGGHV